MTSRLETGLAAGFVWEEDTTVIVVRQLWQRISIDKTVILLRMAALAINAFFAFGNGAQSGAALIATAVAAVFYFGVLLAGRWIPYRTINLVFIPVDLAMVTVGVHVTDGMLSSTYLVYFVEITIAAVYAGFRASLSIGLASALLYLTVLLPESFRPNFWWDYGYRAANLLLMGVGVGFLGHHLRQQIKAMQLQREDARRSLARARALWQLARQVNSDLELERVLDTVLMSAAQLLSINAGGVALVQEDGSLRLKALWGLPSSLLHAGVGTVSEWVQPYEPRLLDGNLSVPTFGGLGFHVGLQAPIAVDNQLVGVLLVVDQTSGRSFSSDEIEALESLAGHAGVALKNARLYEESYRRAEFLASVNKVGQALASTLRPEELYPTIYQEVTSVMPVEGFFIGLWEDEASTLHVKYHMDAKGLRAPYSLRLDRGPTVDAVRNRLPILLELNDEASLSKVTIVGDSDPTRSVLVVPLLAGDRVIGALSAQSYQPHVYKHEHLELLSTIAGLAASALENARLYQRTLELSLTDQLTGLGNARHFHQQLDQELKRALRYGHPVTLLMLDSDSLKTINDRYGHDMGDRHILQLAGVVRSCLRESDLAFRYAGDEFMVLLPETPLVGAMNLAERIRREVEQGELDVGDGTVRSTVSIGVASFPSQAAGSDDLIRVADTAMYVSKQAGKNRVTPAGAVH